MPRFPSTVSARAVLAALLLAGAGLAAARAADLPFPGDAAPRPAAGGGGYWAPFVPVRPAPVRYDIYGYPVFVAPPAPHAIGVGCPPALEPAYDPDGNLAGYAPLQACR